MAGLRVYGRLGVVAALLVVAATSFGQSDYFTEQFIDDFDLDYYSVTFIPDGSDDFYQACTRPISELPTDPSGGNLVDPGEDRYEEVILDFSKTVQLYNFSYTTFYIGANGYITFVDGDTSWEETLSNHFGMRRLALVYDDLSPPGGGTVSWMQLDDRAVVTYENVPEYQMANSNTFQVEMFFDGKIRTSWLNVDSNDSIVGLSRGEGLPGDFTESDLSEYEHCCPGDVDGDDDVDLNDLTVLLAHYGMTSGATYGDGDLDGDGDVDLGDLTTLLANYGTICS
jgi:hypothetical protein